MNHSIIKAAAAFLFSALIFGCTDGSGSSSAPDITPAEKLSGGTAGNEQNSGTSSRVLSQNAEAVLKYISQVFQDGKTIAGQMDLTWKPEIDMAQEVFSDTGRYPALYGFYFMNYTGASYNNTRQTEDAIKWWNGTYVPSESSSERKNGIIAFCWHWRAPGSADGEFYTEKTSFRIPYKDNSLDTTSAEFKAIQNDLSTIAAELKKLKDAGAPVLWRPLHEASGGWFWWGASGKEPYIALYTYMHNYFTKEQNLDNLIWVWNAQNPQWYPGDEYCDIISWDNYNKSELDKNYSTLFGMKTGKPIALSENGAIPEKPYGEKNWSYFMTWNDAGDENDDTEKEDFWSNQEINPAGHRTAIYTAQEVITLDKLPAF